MKKRRVKRRLKVGRLVLVIVLGIGLAISTYFGIKYLLKSSNDKPINKCHDYGWIDDTYTENDVKNELLKPNRKSICINSLNDKIKNIVYHYLDSKFNKKSSFEI